MKRAHADADRPPVITILDGADLFDEWTQRSDALLLHQCNCVTTRAAGLAAEVFRRAPECNDYQQTTMVRRPGRATVHIEKRVVNLYGQRYPGGTRSFESSAQRLLWFERALNHMAAQIKDERRRQLLVPYGIGCGLADGKWEDYEALLERWAAANSARFEVIICRKQQQ